MDLHVYELRMDLIYRQIQTSLSPGSCSDKNEVCQSLPEVLLPYSFWWGWSKWVERCFCYIGWSRPGLLICIAELAAMVVQHFWSHDYFFLWLSQFPNGMIQNKISITMSLVAWRGYTGEDPNKSCVTNESKWKDPMGRKSYWSVIKQVLLNSLCFSQLKATWHISHHKIIYSMDFGWSVFMPNLNFEVPHRKMLYKPT